MLALGGINIIKKPFFALDRRDVLLGVGVFGVLLTYGLGSWLSPRYGVNGLAAALSISTTLQLFVYMFIVQRLIDGGLGLPKLLLYFGKLALASIPSVLAGLLLVGFGNWESGFSVRNILVIASIGGVGGILYVAVSIMLKIPEVLRVVSKFRKKLGI